MTDNSDFLNALCNLGGSVASPAASTTGGGTVVSPTDNWEDISTTGTLACPNLMNALPTVPIQVAFESDLQDMAESINNNALEESHGAHDLRDVQRNSFSRKERNALVHLNIFLRDHFQAYNKETFNRKFLLVGTSKSSSLLWQ